MKAERGRRVQQSFRPNKRMSLNELTWRRRLETIRLIASYLSRCLRPGFCVKRLNESRDSSCVFVVTLEYEFLFSSWEQKSSSLFRFGSTFGFENTSVFSLTCLHLFFLRLQFYVSL